MKKIKNIIYALFMWFTIITTSLFFYESIVILLNTFNVKNNLISLTDLIVHLIFKQ